MNVPFQRLVLCALWLSVGGCRREHVPAQPASGSMDAFQDAPSRLQIPLTDLGVPNAVRTESAPQNPPSPALFPLAVVANGDPGKISKELSLATGRMQVWATPEGKDRKSDILGRVLDKGGKQIGKTYLLRRTSGRVVDLTLGERDGQVYLAWVSILKAEPKREATTLVAILRTEPQFTSATAPVTIEHGTKLSAEVLEEDGLERGPRVRIETPKVGGAAVCFYNRLSPQQAWVAYVSPQMAIRRLGSVEADGGDGSFGGMLDLGSGVLVWTFAWRGGASWGQRYFSYLPGTTEPVLQLSDCRPPMDYTFNGTELITYCPSDYKQEGERCPLAGSDDNLCARIFVQRLDGTVLTPSRTKRAGSTVPILERKYVCRSGYFARQFRWKGGSVFLDTETPDPDAKPCKSGDRPPPYVEEQ